MSSLIARIEVAIEALKEECSCSKDCTRQRANAVQVLDMVRANVEFLQMLAGQEIPGDLPKKKRRASAK